MIPFKHPNGGDCEHACCLKIEHLSVKFGGEAALDDVNLHMHCGQMVALIGPNGAGKSTLIRAILGQREYEGKITFHSADGREEKLRIGYVPQSPTFDPADAVSVMDLFTCCIFKRPAFLRPTRAMREKVTECLTRVHGEGLIDKRVGTLSGGELQRVLLALALEPMPNILILDEPLSGVDVEGMELLMQMLDEIRKKIRPLHPHDHARFFDAAALLRPRRAARGRKAHQERNSAGRFELGRVRPRVPHGRWRGMTLWYALCDALGAEFLSMNFMKNALLAVIVMAPLFGLLSTMIVTGKMSFFSDALGHSGFTGIAIGVLCGAALPIWWAVGLAVAFALLFSFVRSRSSQSADTIIGVFSSTAVALGIFIATMGGGSFTKFNKYLIGDILSVTPGEIGALALVLLAVAALWVLCSNQLILTAIHPQLASSRGVKTARNETLFTVVIAVVVTLAMSWVGLMVINSLLVLPAASARNVAKNVRQYHLFSVLGALLASVAGLILAYYLGCSAGATIALLLALFFAVTFALRRTRA